MKYYTVAEIAEVNRRSGRHFFSKGAMRFFNSKIANNGEVIGGCYFITSEQYDEDAARLFTVRQVKADGDVGTAKDFEFQQFKTMRQARDAAKARVRARLIPVHPFRDISIQCYGCSRMVHERELKAHADASEVFYCEPCIKRLL